MDWRPGNTTCAVSYETVRGVDPQTVVVALTDLETVFPDVERCLRVAHVLTKGISARGEMTVAYVGRWTSEVFTDSPGKFVYRDLTGLSSWTSECRFSYEMRRVVDETGTYRNIPCCSVAWKDGNRWLENIDVMEANFPGFTELCHALCIEQRVAGDEAFKILAVLASSLPFTILKSSTGYFKEQLLLCGALGLPPSAIAAHLLAGVNAVAQPGLELPEISVDQA